MDTRKPPAQTYRILYTERAASNAPHPTGHSRATCHQRPVEIIEIEAGHAPAKPPLSRSLKNSVAARRGDQVYRLLHGRATGKVLAQPVEVDLRLMMSRGASGCRTGAVDRRQVQVAVAALVPGLRYRGVIQPVIDAVGRDLLQALDARHHEGHLGEEQGLAAEDRQELEAHGDEDRAHQHHAHHDYRHHLHLLPASLACKVATTWIRPGVGVFVDGGAGGIVAYAAG